MNSTNAKLIEGLNFETARENLKDVLAKTNLIHSKHFSEMSGNEVYLKPENLQNTGSFKLRGAYNTVAKLSKEELDKGIVTSSAGNHAQGVAFAAQQLGVKAVIVMPETTPLIKVSATRSYGAEVVLHGEVYDDAYAKAVSLEKEHGYTFIHPFDNINVVEGQGTIGVEILEELPDADYILVPIGGGGLVSGVAVAAKRINPDIQIIGVEPEYAQCMIKSLEEDKVICLDSVQTIADGTAVKQPGNLNFDITKEYVDDIVTVSDLEVMETFIDLVQKHKIVSENSGTLSVAALRRLDCKGKKVVSLISGGNMDLLAMSNLISRGLSHTGRIFKFSVNILNQAGELAKITDLIADLGAKIISIKHEHDNCENIFTDVRIEMSIETDGPEHIEEIEDRFEKEGFVLKPMHLIC